MILLEQLTIGINGRTLLRSIDASISPGEFVAILGPNGVGKTTLLRAMCGLHRVREGRIMLNGLPLAERAPGARARTIAFVTSDDVMLDALLVRDVVGTGRFPHHAWWQWNPSSTDESAVSDALQAVEMQSFADRAYATLSSGERQRVWIAMGLAQQTPILLLDEPTSHLDVRVGHEILALLRRLASEGRTIVCVLHDLNDAAAYADRLMLLGDERILAFDRPSEVLTPEIIERAYGIGVERVETARGPRVFARIADPMTHPR